MQHLLPIAQGRTPGRGAAPRKSTISGALINTTCRDVLRYAASVGSLIIGAPLAACSRQPGEAIVAEDITSSAVGPFLVINSDETIQIAYPNPEMGRGIDTSLAMLVAEELGADFDKVETAQLPLSFMDNGEGETRVFHHGGANDSYRARIEGQPGTGDGIVLLTNGTRGIELIREVRRSAEDAFDWTVKEDDGAYTAPDFVD